MGILNNDTQTVDAILTKEGKLALAEGRGLNITGFALSDDFMNYKDYNTAHVSGSSFYAEALENLPLPEAITNSQHAMRFALSTRERNLLFNPYIILAGYSLSDNNVLRIEDQGSEYAIELKPKLVNGTGTPVFQFEVSDTSGLMFSGATRIDKSPSVVNYPRTQKVLSPATFEGSHLMIQADATETAFRTLITIGEMNSGASKIDVEILVDGNIDTKNADKL